MSIEFGAAAYSRMTAATPLTAMAAAKAAAAKDEAVERLTESTDSFTRSVSDEEAAEAASASGDAFVKSEAQEEPADAEGAIYSSSARYTPNAELVERLRSDMEQRMSNLVQMMLGKQLDAASDEDLSYMWNAFRTGEFEATEEEIAQAQKDTAEDGYWGVEQTSDRIVQFATGLTGGDPSKLDSMIEAFEKGYAEAEKAWGGELPELTQRTREAVLEKFKKLKEDADGAAAVSAQQGQTAMESAVQKAMTAAAEE